VLTTLDYGVLGKTGSILFYTILQNLTPIIRRTSATESEKKKPFPTEAEIQT
jgi:hypothetical protein